MKPRLSSRVEVAQSAASRSAMKATLLLHDAGQTAKYDDPWGSTRHAGLQMLACDCAIELPSNRVWVVSELTSSISSVSFAVEA